MKKVLVLITFLLCMTEGMSAQTIDSTKVYQMAAQTMERIQKEGLQFTDSPLEMEKALVQHYARTLNPQQDQEWIGYATSGHGAEGQDISRRMAKDNVIVPFTEQMVNQLKARVHSLFSTKLEAKDAALLLEAYDKALRSEVANIIELSFSLYTIEEGVMFYESYYLLPLEKAADAKQNAFRKATKVLPDAVLRENAI